MSSQNKTVRETQNLQMYNTVTLKSTICQFAYSAKVLVGISYSSPVFFLKFTQKLFTTL